MCPSVSIQDVIARFAFSQVLREGPAFQVQIVQLFLLPGIHRPGDHLFKISHFRL